MQLNRIISVIVRDESALDHLLRGSKGGCTEPQIFLGLKLIHELKDEDKRQIGLQWLQIAASQSNPQALEILKDPFNINEGVPTLSVNSALYGTLNPKSVTLIE